MRRGDIRLVELDPTRGSDTSKRRPAVVINNDGANATADRLGRGMVTVVPLTSNTAHVFAFQTLLPSSATGLPRDSKAQAEQVRSLAVERVGARVGTVPMSLLAELDEALRLHLGL